VITLILALVLQHAIENRPSSLESFCLGASFNLKEILQYRDVGPLNPSNFFKRFLTDFNLSSVGKQSKFSNNYGKVCF